jgi:hypothetical protein
MNEVAPLNEDQTQLVDSLLAATWGSTASYDAPLGLQSRDKGVSDWHGGRLQERL